MFQLVMADEKNNVWIDIINVEKQPEDFYQLPINLLVYKIKPLAHKLQLN